MFLSGHHVNNFAGCFGLQSLMNKIAMYLQMEK